MSHITDREYLSHPLIENITYIIDNDCVDIFSESTCFVRHKLLSYIDVFGLLRLYQEVIQKAKAQGVSISYSMHIKKNLLDKQEEYKKSHKEAFVLFSCIVEQAKIVRGRGIHYGCVNDKELDKLYELSSQYEKYFWRNSVISEIFEYSCRLKDLQTSLSQNGSIHGELIKICA